MIDVALGFDSDYVKTVNKYLLRFYNDRFANGHLEDCQLRRGQFPTPELVPSITGQYWLKPQLGVANALFAVDYYIAPWQFYNWVKAGYQNSQSGMYEKTQFTALFWILQVSLDTPGLLRLDSAD